MHGKSILFTKGDGNRSINYIAYKAKIEEPEHLNFHALTNTKRCETEMKLQTITKPRKP